MQIYFVNRYTRTQPEFVYFREMFISKHVLHPVMAYFDNCCASQINSMKALLVVNKTLAFIGNVKTRVACV